MCPFPFYVPFQAACSPEGLSSKHASQWLDRLRPSLQHENARDGVKGLLGALAECERGDPLRTLEAVEGFLVELRQVTHTYIHTYSIYTHLSIKGLLGALAECERGDPLRTLEAVEGFLVELRQVTHINLYIHI
jgi:hypothetical protein